MFKFSNIIGFFETFSNCFHYSCYNWMCVCCAPWVWYGCKTWFIGFHLHFAFFAAGIFYLKKLFKSHKLASNIYFDLLFAIIRHLPNPTFMSSLSEIGDLSWFLIDWPLRKSTTIFSKLSQSLEKETFVCSSQVTEQRRHYYTLSFVYIAFHTQKVSYCWWIQIYTSRVQCIA